ncbi:MAG: carboxylesterase family protein [Acidobacteria bacterium]|nr:carboxylesterase family protein [Acidobacteriota bacterium]
MRIHQLARPFGRAGSLAGAILLRRKLPAVILCGTLFLSACGAAGTGEMAGDVLGPVIETSLGALEGQHVAGDDGVLVFRGVPYAEPPVGAGRWRAPVAKASWEGTRSAAAFGPACWQRLTPESSVYTRGDLDRDEDCLYLNVWTAAEDAAEARPVMVWFHGGGHTGGWGSAKIFDGTALAEKGVVLVTINYRLGPFGFLAHPALTAESPHASSGNYGLLDKVAALEWVRDNIAAFGGDPGNVTIFGQSAGSWSVCYLMASPQAAGLFHKAIGHSGGCFRGGRPDLATAQEAGLAAAAGLGVDGDGPEALAALRALDAEAVLDSNLGSGAIVDGWFMPRAARAIFEAGEHNDVPVIVGALANEGTTLYANMPERTEAELVSLLREQYGDDADALLAAYAPEVERSTKWGAQAIQADRSFVWEMRTWARVVEATGSDAWLYFFSQAPPVFRIYVPERAAIDMPDGPDGYGAYHSGDLAYAFGNTRLVGIDWTEWDHEIANAVTQYWVNFARTGDPNGNGLATWPRYQAAADEWLEFGTDIKTTREVRKEKLDLFDRINAPPAS